MDDTDRAGQTNPVKPIAMPLMLSRLLLEEEHQRLGYIGIGKLLELAKAGQLKYIHEVLAKDHFKSMDCETCQLQKAVRAPKDDISPKGTRDGKLTHVDLARPVIPRSTGTQCS